MAGEQGLSSGRDAGGHCFAKGVGERSSRRIGSRRGAGWLVVNTSAAKGILFGSRSGQLAMGSFVTRAHVCACTRLQETRSCPPGRSSHSAWSNPPSCGSRTIDAEYWPILRTTRTSTTSALHLHAVRRGPPL
ncbi:Protein of unknown function [Gryllus bimaculatus]|nr:Protein of unknown function [Gryllus bimaculatus]